jgi:predicted acetyltransferase
MKYILVKTNDHHHKHFANLQQLYEFEFSPITGSKTNEDGLYDQQEIMSHWSKSGHDIYILYRMVPEGPKKPIGFAVVNLSGMIDGDNNTRDIAEFFVLPEARKEKAGTWLAHEVFKKYPGKWEVRQLPGLKAKGFWLSAIEEFTNGQFENVEMDNQQWQGSVQKFVAPRLEEKDTVKKKLSESNFSENISASRWHPIHQDVVNSGNDSQSLIPATSTVTVSTQKK